MVRVIINYRDEDVVDKIKELAKIIYSSDLIKVIGADVPEDKIEYIKRIKGVQKVSPAGKAEILS